MAHGLVNHFASGFEVVSVFDSQERPAEFSRNRETFFTWVRRRAFR